MKTHRLGSQAGSGAVNLVLITSFSMAAVYGVSTQISGSLKLKASSDKTAASKQRHESAFQLISQLVNTGALYHDTALGDALMVNPSASGNACVNNATFGKAPDLNKGNWCFLGSAAGAQTEFLVRVCETKAGLPPTKTVADGCPEGQVPIIVYTKKIRVEADGSDKGTVMRAHSPFPLKAGQAKYDLESEARVKTFVNKKIDKFVSDTDYCYFMRPLGTKEQQRIDDSVNGSRNPAPREEGTEPGQWKGKFELPPVSDASAYEVLPNLRIQLQEKYRNNLRGAAITGNELKLDNKVFVGVQPNQGAQGGPQFQYFLGATPEAVHRQDLTAWHDPTETDPSWRKPYKEIYDWGCNTTTGSAAPTTGAHRPDFCTRVHLPYKKYSLTLGNTCVAHTKQLKSWPVMGKASVCKNEVVKEVIKVRVERTPRAEFTPEPELVTTENGEGGPFLGGTPKAIATPTAKPTEAPDEYVYKTVYKTVEKCNDEERQIGEKGESFSLQLRDQIVCLDTWPTLVENAVNSLESEKRSNGLPLHEVNIGEYIGLVELSGEGLASFTTRHGSAGQAVLTAAVQRAVAKLTNSPTPAGVIQGSLNPNGTALGYAQDIANANIVYKGSSKVKEVTYHTLGKLDKTENLKAHTSERCAYFRYYDTKNPQTCKVDVLTSGGDSDGWWVCRTSDGCFEASTRIRLGDGSEKAIIDLKPTDVVFNPRTGNSQEIDHLTVGPEKETMYRIGYSGRIVEVTKTHPFFTAQGWVQAQNLQLGSAVLDASNSFRPLEVVEPFKNSQPPTVVNLVLKGDGNNPDEHFVMANGVITGDLLIQNRLEKGEMK